MPHPPQSRRWCFTLNNPLVATLELLQENPSVTYGVVGREVGDSGTPHLQGFLYFGANKRLAAVRGVLAEAHWEVARGSIDQNRVYCTKDGDFVEWGEKPVERTEAGSREASRWALAYEAAKVGDMDAIPGDVHLRAYRTIRQITVDFMTAPADLEDVCGVWIHGPAGAGKSHLARERFPDFYAKMANKWWDGYQNQEYVIMDDVDANHKVLGHHFKLWMDKWPFLAEVKGGTLYIRPLKFVVTSQYAPDEIFEDQATLAAIERRCEVVHLEARETG